MREPGKARPRRVTMTCLSQRRRAKRNPLHSANPPYLSQDFEQKKGPSSESPCGASYVISCFSELIELLPIVRLGLDMVSMIRSPDLRCGRIPLSQDRLRVRHRCRL